MDIEVRYSGADGRNKYKIESYYGGIEISRIKDTTDYSGALGDKKIVNTEEITTIVIPHHDLSTLVLSLQKILY